MRATRTQGSPSRRQCHLVQRSAQGQGGVLLKPEFIQIDDLGALPADEQGLGGQAGRGPALDEGEKIGFRIDAQNEHAQRPAGVRLVENGDQDGQMDLLAVVTAIKILKRHLARPQDF